MLCNEFEARMQQLLDQRRAPDRDAALLSHARQCGRCHGQLTTLLRLLDSLDLLDLPPISPEFAQHVVDDVVAAQPRSPRSTNAWRIAATAVAATLLLSILPLVWHSGNARSGNARSGNARSGNASPNAPPSPSSAISPEPGSVAETDDRWLVSPDLLELYPEETRRRHRQQVHQIADDLRPIATPFNAALSAIRRSLPVGKSDRQTEPRASIDPGPPPAIS